MDQEQLEIWKVQARQQYPLKVPDNKIDMRSRLE